jgi:hypothetical protein
VTDAMKVQEIKNITRANLEMLEKWTIPNVAMRNAILRALNAIDEIIEPSLPEITHPGYDRILDDIERSNVEPVDADRAEKAIGLAAEFGWIREGGRA